MKRILFFAATATPLLALAVFEIRSELREVDIDATHSAAASIQKGFVDSGALEVPAGDWWLLNESEYESAIEALVDAGRSLDQCPKCHTASGAIADAWGNRFQIAARQERNREPEFIVWSNGPDGVPGSGDEIVVPEDAKDEIVAISKLASVERN